MTTIEGHDHWGQHGAAGLLLVDDTGRVLLQRRGRGVSDPGTWSTIGGVLAGDEVPLAGALREAHEEADTDPEHIEPIREDVCDCGGWTYTTVVARYAGPELTGSGDGEGAELRWVDPGEVPSLNLLGSFRAYWPRYLSVHPVAS